MKKLNLNFWLVIFAMVCLSLPNNSNAQSQLQKVYGRYYFHDLGYSIQYNPIHKEYAIAGVSNAGFIGNTDATVIRTDENGVILAEVAYGGPNEDAFYCIRDMQDNLPGSDLRYVAVGRTNSFGNGQFDVLFVGMDENLNRIFSTSFGGSGYDEGKCVQLVKDPVYGLCFVILGTGEFQQDKDIYLIKTDLDGNCIQEKHIEAAQHQRGAWIEQTQDGGLILTGSCRGGSNNGTDMDIYVAKLNINFVVDWANAYGHETKVGDDIGFSIKEDVEGEILVTGTTESLATADDRDDIFLLKLRENGDLRFMNVYTNGHDDGGQGLILQQTGNGYNCIISGYTTIEEDPNTLNMNSVIMKTDAQGGIIYDESYGLDRYDMGLEIVAVSDEFLAATGGFKSLMAPGYCDQSLNVVKQSDGDSGTPCQEDVKFERTPKEPKILHKGVEVNLPCSQIDSILVPEPPYFFKDVCEEPGSKHLSLENSDNELDDVIEFSVYPSPVSSNITVEYGSDYNGGTISIIDINGKSLYQGVLNSENKINISVEEFPAGLYVIQILNKDGFESLKFRKE